MRDRPVLRHSMHLVCFFPTPVWQVYHTPQGRVNTGRSRSLTGAHGQAILDAVRTLKSEQRAIGAMCAIGIR